MLESEENHVEKHPQLGIGEFEDKDLRGILAVMGWLGFLVMLGICIILDRPEALQQVAAILGTPIGLITGYYFSANGDK